MPEARDLIHLPGEDIVVGGSMRKKEFRGRKGRFVRYDMAVVEVDGEHHAITTQNVHKACPSCNIAASAHCEKPCDLG